MGLRIGLWAGLGRAVGGTEGGAVGKAVSSYTHMSRLSWTCMWKTEANVGCLPLSRSTLFFKLSLSLDLELTT